jgi:HK97 gp10 family phage protein
VAKKVGRQNVIEIKGLKRAMRLMKDLDGDFKKQFKDIHKGASDIVADEARRLAPVKTGKLRRSIRTSGTNKGGVIRIGKKKIPYAGRVTFGDPTSLFGRIRGGGGIKIKGNPFFYEAADRQFKQVVEYYDEELEQILDRALKASKAAPDGR